jgi:hypothetical protein
MRTGLDFKSAPWGLDQISSPHHEDWTRFQVRGLVQNARTWNLVQSELEGLKLHPMRVNHYLKWGELILIQSKDWINFDPVLGLDQYTSPGIQYYHESKIKQYGWLIYSWIINDLRYMFSIACFLLQPHYNETLRVSLYWEQRRHLTVRIKGGGGVVAQQRA